MAVLGLRFCARAFSSCSKRGPLFITVRRPLTIAVSLAAEHRLQTRRLSNCGSRAQPLRGMWDLPRPGLEPVSPALAGRFSTTAPPGSPIIRTLNPDIRMLGAWSILPRQDTGEKMHPMGDETVQCLPIKILIYYLMTLQKGSHLYTETVCIFWYYII